MMKPTGNIECDPMAISLAKQKNSVDIVIANKGGLKLGVYSLSGTRIDRRSVFGL